MRLNNVIGKTRRILRSQRGVALMTVYMASFFLASIAAATYTRSIMQSKAVEKEIARLKSFAVAEAGLQSALAQIGTNAYTGYINDDDIDQDLTNLTGTENIAHYSVDIEYPGEADWVILKATGTVTKEQTGADDTKTLEGRVFLNSNLSKYMFYSDTSSLALGNNLVFGSDDGSAQHIPEDPLDRMQTYHTGDLDFSGTNIKIYGDVNAESSVDGNSYSNNNIYGDTYAGDFALNANGTVANDGVNTDSNLTISDGYSDDTDRNKDGNINSTDAPDRHDLTSDGANDSHAVDPLDDVNLSFYKTNKDSSLPSSWAGTTTTSRFIELSASGTKTKVTEYTDGTFSSQSASYTLSDENAIIYNTGSLYIKSDSVIAGRVSVVSSQDIFFEGNVTYNNASGSYCDEDNSAAWIATRKAYVLPTSIEVSGIVYARNTGSSGTALNASYIRETTTTTKRGKTTTTTSIVPISSGEKEDGHFRIFGNVIIDGTADTSVYTNDRAYVYDPNIKYYRPPGIPVVPELILVREDTAETEEE